MNLKISHPWIALGIIFVLSAILSEYGVTKGSLFLFDVFAGIGIYKWITSRSQI